jgi:SNF2 family DNA or RNA helicase
MIQLSTGEEMTIMHLIALITRKRQANVWPGGIQMVHPQTGEILFSVGDEVQESCKMDAVFASIIDHLPRRQIVFSQFKTALAELEERLTYAGVEVVRFDGSTPKAVREQVRADFKRGDGPHKWDVILANYKTGGAGLNLTAATVNHILDEEWNPGKRNQAYARDHRIGQTEEVDTYVYRIPGSIDTWMSNTIARKQRILEGFEGAMRGETELSVDSFKNALLGGML